MTLKAPKPNPKYPKEIRHLGDHIRRRRVALGLRLKDVARAMGINLSTVINWEKRGTPPAPRCLPAIVRFLGYDPRPTLVPAATASLGQQVKAMRERMGLSQRALAKQLGVDEHTVWGWERGRRRILGKYVPLVGSFLREGEGTKPK